MLLFLSKSPVDEYFKDLSTFGGTLKPKLNKSAGEEIGSVKEK